MSQRAERDLRNCPLFSKPEIGVWDNRENMPWPRPGESLLSAHRGDEAYVFPYDQWIPDELERLSFFAMLFVERARDLVRQWLDSRDKSENYVNVIGYLYRHAIELQLKAIVARSTAFRALNLKEQRDLIDDHSLHRLWNRAATLSPALFNDPEAKVVEGQLLELHHLDERSDGFRYPFRFIDKNGQRQSVLDAAIRFQSFDNFVWVLEGLYSWLDATQDEEERQREFEAEMARNTGW